MCLIEISDNIWNLEGDAVKMLTIPFQTRMTIVRLANRSLWLHSPVAFTQARSEAIDKLGKVSFIVGPNIFHHLSLGEWLNRYPDAELWGAHGLPEKRRDLSFTGVLQNYPETQWENEIDQLYFQGSNILPEVVFYHKPSKTLILTDLIQNHDPLVENWFWKIVKRINGVLAPHGGVPKDLRLTIRDKKKARESLEKLLSWDFDRMIIGHGLCIEDNAIEYVRKSFSWLKR